MAVCQKLNISPLRIAKSSSLLDRASGEKRNAFVFVCQIIKGSPAYREKEWSTNCNGSSWTED